MTDPTAVPPFAEQRRGNLFLRALIDEMLEQVRELDRHSASMGTEERVRAERALDELMARVRRAAMKGPAA